MLWDVEIQSKGHDVEHHRVVAELDLLTHAQGGAAIIARSARGYLLPGHLSQDQIDTLTRELLVDPLAETASVSRLQAGGPSGDNRHRIVQVLLKPGVMDPVTLSVAQAARDLGIPVESVRTFRRYYLARSVFPGAVATADAALKKALVNDAIEQWIEGPLAAEHLTLGAPYTFHLITLPVRELDDTALEKLSRQNQLSLSRAEMQTIQDHYRTLGRDPTDIELETLAQTWSEHCSHKTLKGKIDFDGRRIDNLLQETIFQATAEIRRRLGRADWCVSVFEDNAGVVQFDARYHVCFKVETHNHPSALEPYGGANTGLGGVIRDPLGTGLGAKPICNTDVFCFAPPDTPPETLPGGVLHPKKVMKGVVAGVRDYGNRMGIPTVNGAVCFDDRYLGNPLVFCGTVGILPVDRCHKDPQAGDFIVVIGGRTGRDGIHGATFSSTGLTAESEQVSGGAVQIGNAITEKKLVDVILQARDRGLYHAITDCGAGGFSSAVGEMAAGLGAVVRLDQALLKYEGLSYTEIWISESQERMILAVPSNAWPGLLALCTGEDVEATVIGHFESSSRLRLYYQEHQVADLDMEFLHHGRPPMLRKATRGAPGEDGNLSGPNAAIPFSAPPRKTSFTGDLLRILASYNVCSKEWIIRQYDHEVQGGTVIKPLVGFLEDGPGDAAVVTPVLGSWSGLALGCGINPRYGELDPYWMAASVIDEAVRNVVAVGADPSRVALLDNFCWGDTDRSEVLGSLVRAAEACRDVALAFGMPFISGKDSLKNEYHSGDRYITIPPTLLISAMGYVPDVRRCVTMDYKEADDWLFLLGLTRNEMGGSYYNLVNRIEGGMPPQVDLDQAPRIFHQLHQAIHQGLIRACHDLSEGGLAVAVAEMAFAGGIGAEITNLGGEVAQGPDEVLLFSESNTRFIVEVKPENADALRRCFGDDVPLARIGQTCQEAGLRIAGAAGDWLVRASLADLKEAWQKPLRW